MYDMKRVSFMVLFLLFSFIQWNHRFESVTVFLLRATDYLWYHVYNLCVLYVQRLNEFHIFTSKIIIRASKKTEKESDGKIQSSEPYFLTKKKQMTTKTPTKIYKQIFETNAYFICNIEWACMRIKRNNGASFLMSYNFIDFNKS